MANSTCVAVTAGRYFTPAGRWPGDGRDLTEAERETPQGKLRGIEPLHYVKADKELVYGEGHDNQLQYALEILKEKK